MLYFWKPIIHEASKPTESTQFTFYTTHCFCLAVAIQYSLYYLFKFFLPNLTKIQSISSTNRITPWHNIQLSHIPYIFFIFWNICCFTLHNILIIHFQKRNLSATLLLNIPPIRSISSNIQRQSFFI